MNDGEDTIGAQNAENTINGLAEAGCATETTSASASAIVTQDQQTTAGSNTDGTQLSPEKDATTTATNATSPPKVPAEMEADKNQQCETETKETDENEGEIRSPETIATNTTTNDTSSQQAPVGMESNDNVQSETEEDERDIRTKLDSVSTTVTLKMRPSMLPFFTHLQGETVEGITRLHAYAHDVNSNPIHATRVYQMMDHSAGHPMTRDKERAYFSEYGDDTIALQTFRSRQKEVSHNCDKVTIIL